MSSQSKTKGARGALAVALTAGAMLGGCSDIYYDRRETVSLSANDAIETNKVTHMVDPWPRYSANNNLAFNGERMQVSVECYRQSRVTPPVAPTTTSTGQSSTGSSATSAAQSTKCTQSNAVTGTPAAPVKSP